MSDLIIESELISCIDVAHCIHCDVRAIQHEQRLHVGLSRSSGQIKTPTKRDESVSPNHQEAEQTASITVCTRSYVAAVVEHARNVATLAGVHGVGVAVLTARMHGRSDEKIDKRLPNASGRASLDLLTFSVPRLDHV